MASLSGENTAQTTAKFDLLKDSDFEISEKTSINDNISSSLFLSNLAEEDFAESSQFNDPSSSSSSPSLLSLPSSSSSSLPPPFSLPSKSSPSLPSANFSDDFMSVPESSPLVMYIAISVGIGGVVVVALVALLVWCWCRRFGSRDRHLLANTATGSVEGGSAITEAQKKEALFKEIRRDVAAVENDGFLRHLEVYMMPQVEIVSGGGGYSAVAPHQLGTNDNGIGLTSHRHHQRHHHHRPGHQRHQRHHHRNNGSKSGATTALIGNNSNTNCKNKNSSSSSQAFLVASPPLGDSSSNNNTNNSSHLCASSTSMITRSSTMTTTASSISSYSSASSMSSCSHNASNSNNNGGAGGCSNNYVHRHHTTPSRKYPHHHTLSSLAAAQGSVPFRRYDEFDEDDRLVLADSSDQR